MTLWNGLCRYLLDVDGWDKAYVAQHVSGFEALAGALDDPAWQLDEVARSCGLSRSDLLGFYQLFARTPKLSPCSARINQSNQGVDKANAIINAHLMCGRIGKPGAAPFSMTGQPNAMGGREVGGLATQLAAHMGFGEAECDRVQRFWGSPTMVRGPGHKAVELFEAVHRGDPRALGARHQPGGLPAGRQPGARGPEPLRAAGGLRGDGQHRHGAPRPPAVACRRLGEKSGTVTNSERTISRQRAFLPLPGRPGPTGGP